MPEFFEEPRPTELSERVLAAKERDRKVLEQAMVGVGDDFDKDGGGKKIIDRLLESNGSVFRKVFEGQAEVFESIERELRACESITEREAFVAGVFSALGPYLEFRINHPEEHEKIKRDVAAEKIDRMRLSEVLSCNEADAGKTIEIHVGESRTMALRDMRHSVEEGLEALAEIVERNENIEQIRGTSWILGKNPKLGMLIGFKNIHILTSEEKEKRKIENPDPVGEGIISREDFLKKPWKNKLKGPK